jgi:DNA (cytosine-5)-methyltransferase 1
MKALDLFAGTGWGVACRRLGIEEYGVEIMPEAIATREANGMETIYADVWDGLRGQHEVPSYDLLIASPPCQTFSMAGSGAGRRALDDVLAAIDAGAYGDVEQLHALGLATDMRTALVLTPLAHLVRDRPARVVFEQVPQVLPIWEACADVMRSLGYSVWTGILNSEQYGVPQTRRRAILIASLFGEAKPPSPTYSRYYSQNPTRLDPDVLPWVSMADALGWGMTERPALTVTGHGPLTRQPTGQQNAVRAAIEAGEFLFRPPFTPETAVTDHEERLSLSRGFAAGSVSFTPEEAGVLQSYPRGFEFAGKRSKQFLQVGNAVPPLMAQAILTTILKGA